MSWIVTRIQRVSKLWQGSLFLVIFITGIQFSGFAEVEGNWSSIYGKHEQELSWNLDALPGDRFEIGNRNGAITITGWDKHEVCIEAKKTMRVKKKKSFFWSWGGGTFDSASDAKDYFDDLKIDVVKEGNTIKVKTQYPPHKKHVQTNLEFKVHVPRKIDLEAQTSNGAVVASNLSGPIMLKTSNGRINAWDMAGDIKMNTSNGAIELKNSRGFFDLHTSNGAIVVKDCKGILYADTSNGRINCDWGQKSATGAVLGATEDIKLTTSNGTILLSLPSGSSFDLDARTSNGSILSDFAVKMSGKFGKHVEGVVGKGGPKVSLKTTNGKIRIEEK